MSQYDSIAEEAGLGSNWIPVDRPAIIPGQMVAAPPASDFSPTNPKYIQGSIAPNFQHDSSFVDTGDRTSHVPKFDLMPLGPQENAVVSTQISSAVKSVVEVVSGQSLLLETDSVKNPNQSILNIIGAGGISATADPSGNVTLTGSASAPQWPLPNTAVAYMARAIVGATALQTIGDSSTGSASAGTGAVSNGTAPTSTDGVVVPIGSGTTPNSVFGFFPINQGIFWAGRGNKFQCRFRLPNAADLVNTRIWVGFTNVTPTGLRTDSPSGAVLAFLYSPGSGGSTGFWQCVGASAVVTSVAPDNNTHRYEIDVTDAGAVTFLIDGVVVATSPTSSAGFVWWPTVTIGNNGTSVANPSGSVHLFLEYFYAQQDF